MFEEYPIRRELEENEFTGYVRTVFEASQLGKVGFEPASMDLIHVLPVKTWKEVVRGHLSSDYRDQLRRWAAWFQELATSEIRKLALSIFPREMCRGREYRKTKGRATWTLSRHGDI